MQSIEWKQSYYLQKDLKKILNISSTVLVYALRKKSCSFVYSLILL